MNGLSWFTLFVIANVAQFAIGLSITGLSYGAYRSSARKRIFRNSTLGFLAITIGGILAPVYELGIKGDYSITARELLQLQVIEGSVIALGLGLLLISVLGHNTDTESTRTVFDSDVSDCVKNITDEPE